MGKFQDLFHFGILGAIDGREVKVLKNKPWDHKKYWEIKGEVGVT